jgi:hypothetical protein
MVNLEGSVRDRSRLILPSRNTGGLHQPTNKVADSTASSSCGSTVLVRNSTASDQRFKNLIKTHGRTPLDEWSACRRDLYLHRTT